MWPDDRLPIDLLDADLVELDETLERAGAAARRHEPADVRPDRAFADGLRARLTGALPAPGHASGGAPEAALDAPAWAPAPLRPRLSVRRRSLPSRWSWGLAAATLTVAVVAAGGGLGLNLVAPTPSEPASLSPFETPAPARSDPASPPPLTTVPPAPERTTTPTAKPTPRPTPKPTPKPTPDPTPDPTKPPIGTMSLSLTACPGAVVLDWSKPKTAGVDHYRVLRAVGGEVAATWPAPGTTKVATAASWDPATTDGFDPDVASESKISYRAFAFDAKDELVAVSPMRTTTAVSLIELGEISVVDDGPGAITASWASPGVAADCFTYGKLVASTDDPDPSYLDGDPYLAVVGDPAAVEVSVMGLPSGKTVWLRYEVIRSTGTGKFLVARTDAMQVTIP
jgi:hypothetical protein